MELTKSKWPSWPICGPAPAPPRDTGREHDRAIDTGSISCDGTMIPLRAPSAAIPPGRPSLSPTWGNNSCPSTRPGHQRRNSNVYLRRRSDAMREAGRNFHFTPKPKLPPISRFICWLFRRRLSRSAGCFLQHSDADGEQTVARMVYGCGLIGMLTASAAYNFSLPSRRKELLRRIDHAMIFVMIAGTYTPFTLSVFAPGRPAALSADLVIGRDRCRPVPSFPPPLRTAVTGALSHHGMDGSRHGRTFIHLLATPVLFRCSPGAGAYTLGRGHS